MTSDLEKRLKKKISIEFRNAPIEDVLTLLANQADVDIVKSPSVTGSVTVKLTDVPLGEALNNVLAAHGYGYSADKNVLRVAPVDEIKQVAERIITRIYRIRYADVKKVESALRRFISKYGLLSSVPSKSNIIVTDTERQIKAIDEVIKEVDRAESAGGRTSQKKPAEIEKSATPAKVINIRTFKGVLGDVQAENVQTGDYASIKKNTGTGEKKKGILRRIPLWMYYILGALAALLTILHFLGLL